MQKRPIALKAMSLARTTPITGKTGSREIAAVGDAGQRRLIGIGVLNKPVPQGCRTPHDGMAEAVLLAEYGRRMYSRPENDI